MEELEGRLSWSFADAENESDAARSLQFARTVLTSHIRLLKSALDRSDQEFFRVALQGYRRGLKLDLASQRIGASWDRRSGYLFVEHLDLINQARARIVQACSDFSDAQLFAFGGWLCSQFASQRLVGEAFALAFKQVANGFGEFAPLWRVFNKTLEADQRMELPLLDWNLDPEGGGAPMVRSETQILMFLVIVGLRTISAGDADRYAELYHTPLAGWRRDDVELVLTEIARDRERWEASLGPFNSDERADELRAVMAAAASRQERIERTRIIEQEPDAQRLLLFKSSFLAAWATGAYVRHMLQRRDLIDYLPLEGTRSTRGIWKFVPKGPFIADPGNVNWGEDYGAEFGSGSAAGEEEEILLTIRDAAPVVSVSIDGLVSAVQDTIRRLRESDLVPDMALFGGDWRLLRALEDAGVLVPTWQIEPDERLTGDFRGLLDGMPAYRMPPKARENEVVIVSLMNVGRLKQYVAGVADDRSIFKEFSIRFYSQEEAAATAAGDRNTLPAEWRTLDAAELADILRERALLAISESFEFIVTNRLAAVRIVVGDLTPE